MYSLGVEVMEENCMEKRRTNNMKSGERGKREFSCD